MPTATSKSAAAIPIMFRLAKEQGYETYFYSAQAENEMAILNLIGKKWIDHLIQPTQLGYGNGDNMPDEKLLPLFDKINLRQASILSYCTNAVRTSHTAHCCSLKIKFSAKPILWISTTTPSIKPTK